MSKDSFKLINKLIDNILLDRSFLDQDLENNLSILDALIQSGLTPHLSQLGTKAIRTNKVPHLLERSAIDSGLLNCLKAIDLVCVNAPTILVHKISPNVDLKKVERPQPSAHSAKPQNYTILIGTLVKFFKFDDGGLNGTIEKLIIKIVNLISTRIRSLKSRKGLTQFLISKVLSHHLAKSFGGHDPTFAFSNLIISIQCFRLINHYKIHGMLLLNGATEATLNKISRKIWYLLNNCTIYEDSLETMDNYKALFLSKVINSCFTNEDSVLTSKLAISLELVHDVLLTLIRSPASLKIQKTLAANLLNLFYKCVKLKITETVISGLKLNNLLLIGDVTQSRIDQNLIRVLYIIIKNPDTQNGIFDSLVRHFKTRFSFLDKPFQADEYLNKLSLRISALYETNNSYEMSLALDIITENNAKPSMIVMFEKEKKLSQWVDNLEDVLNKNSEAIFESNIATLNLIKSVGLFSCIFSNHYDFEISQCELCENVNNVKFIKENRKLLPSSPIMVKLVGILNKFLLSNNAVLASDVLIVNVLITLKRIFVKYTLPPIGSANDSVFKLLCTCLFSRNRYVRILAGKMFSLYLLSEDNKNDLSNNCSHIFQFLDNQLTIDDKSSYLAESKILVWGELVMVLEGEVLNVVLVKLFDFFSSSNLFHTCAAYTTLINVAKLKNETCWQLISPFLPNLSLTMVKQIVNKSIFGSIIPEFLNVSANDILFRTITYTVPYLLTYYSKDIIREISKVAKVPKFKLINQVMPRILAVLLTSSEYLDIEDNDQSYIINEDKIMEVLIIVDPYFKNKRVSDFVEPLQDIWEICKMYSIDEKNDLRIKNALIYIIKLEKANESPNSKYAQKLALARRYNLSQPCSNEDEKLLQDCFKGSLLGIVQLFSDVVKDTRGRTPYVEKLKSLTAIEFLVQISGVEIVTALPQICISLQKSISDPLLEFQTLRCWKILILNLKDIHLSTCFDLVIAIILQRWKYFEKNSRKIAKEILIELFNKEDLIRDKFFNYYFTLSFNDGLVDVYYKANKILKGKKNINGGANATPNDQSMVLNLLYDITRRCQNDNKYVVQQALTDLVNFLNQYKKDFHSNFLQKKHFVNFIPVLIDILLKNCSKFKSYNDNKAVPDDTTNIPKECTKCLGLIGSLDPDRFEFKDKEKELTCDFSSVKELIQFTAEFLNLLVKAFWASEDPGKQIFLAYGMQEFIQLCGVKDLSSVSFFSDLTISTLTPLVTSRYKLNSIGLRKFNYPMFKLTKNHAEWVRDFTLDLLQKSRQSCINPENDKFEINFYSVYETIIKGQDIKISLVVLPYVALNMIIKDFDSSRTIIQNEFLEILNTDCDVETYTHEISKNIKLFYQTIFKMLDYLREWLANKKQKQYSSRHRRKGLFGVSNGDGIKIVESFLSNIPDMLISRRSSQCASYERAVLYLEQGYRANTTNNVGLNSQENELIFSQLREMYEKLDDYDALTGSLKQFSRVNIRSAVSQLQYEDNWKSILGAFEVMSDITSDESGDQPNIKYLQYLNKKNLHPEVLVRLNKTFGNLVPGDPLDSESVPTDLISVALQSSMFECDIGSLKKWVSIADISGPINDSGFLANVLISKALVSLNDGDIDSFDNSVERCYTLIGSSLSLSPATSLSRNKELINKLHILEDIKELSRVKSPADYKKNNQIFDSRVKNCGFDFESPWYILTMRKAAELLACKPNEDNSDNRVTSNKSQNVSKLWLERSRIEIDHNRLDLASRSAIQSYIAFKNYNAELQYAEILWAQGDYSKALKIVQTLKNIESDRSNSSDIEWHHQKAKVQLKYANWLESSNNGLSSEIIKEFEKAIDLDNKWQDPYYYLGKYYTKVLESKELKRERENLEGIGVYEDLIIHNYLSSIAHGDKYLQEILPKIITLWIDFSWKSEYNTVPQYYHNLTRIESEIGKSAKSLPKYYWFTVFSQLLSRLPRTQGTTFKAIIDICALVTQHYPEQALWSVFAQCNSGDAKRSTAGKKIISKFARSECKIQKYSSNKAIYTSAGNVFNAFKKMTKIEKSRGMKECSLSDDFRFDHSVVPAPVVVPCKQNFKIASLSSTGFNYNNVTIVKFEDRVKIMSSLQRPRRIEVIGSDGKNYSLLFKLNDDLRKDAKLMELTSMIDHLLQKNYESKKRNLHINTFAVVPLNESYGIIEWVQNHVTMKSILDKKYENKESLLHIKKQYDVKKHFSEKLSYFKHLLTYFQPVLYQWFIEFFPTPSVWYTSRNSFVRTLAVMSMVGYILGIGDRHGENILISQTNGDVLHVDFDCLFEKGLILRIPERVPFRLTNNIVDACGICGIEGTFRQSSEVTMQLLRNNEAILMNILEAFIYDPIMEWQGSKLGSPESTLAKIRAKIRGILEKEAIPMSIPGQVNYLIKEATSSEHLCQMYFGWLPFW